MYAYLTGNNKLLDVSYKWLHYIKFVTINFFYLIYILNFLVPFSLALFYWSIHNLVDEITGAQQNIIWQMTVALGEAGYGVAWWELQLHAGYYFEIKYECWEFLKNSAKTTTKKVVRQTGHIYNAAGCLYKLDGDQCHVQGACKVCELCPKPLIQFE